MSKIRRSVSAGGEVRMLHWCPGCKEVHSIRTSGSPPTWGFNRNYETPAFEPSIRVFVTHFEDDDGKKLPNPVQETLCHYFIRTGSQLAGRGANLDTGKSYIDFCGDSPHELRGKIVELPDWPYVEGAYGGIEDE